MQLHTYESTKSFPLRSMQTLPALALFHGGFRAIYSKTVVRMGYNHAYQWHCCRERENGSYLRIIIHVMCSHRCRYLLPQPATAATSREPKCRHAGQDNDRTRGAGTLALARHRICKRKAKSLRSRALERRLRRGGHGTH